MDGIMTILLTIVILVGVVTIIYIVNFNNLQAYKIKINEAESIIDDLLRKKYDNLLLIKDVIVEETDVEYELVNGKFITPVEKLEDEAKRIAKLKMTPLDFIKALEEVGVSYSQIKELCNTNEEVEKQLRFCNHVYRGNPLLDQLCGLFNVTAEQLNELFKKYGT